MSEGTITQPQRPRSGVGRGPWFVPVTVAVVAVAGFAWVATRVRGPVLRIDAAADRRPPDLVVTRMDWLEAGGALRERLKLLDPAPLYMPADWHVGSLVGAEAAAGRPGGVATRSFPPALAFSDERPTKDIARANPPQTPLAASDAVSTTRWFEGMARRDDPAGGGAPARAGGRMDVYRVGEAERAATLELSLDETLAAADWRPIELLVLIRAAGPVALPAVTTGSGTVEIDERVRALAMAEWLPRLLLRPGAYRLVVGP